MRATVSDMGPLLLGRMLGLNETQSGVLNLVFKIADDNGLLLLDLKDPRAMLRHVGDNAAQFRTQYGNVSAASVGIIQRGLLQIESQGGEKFFGEPMLDIADFLQTDEQGHVLSPAQSHRDEVTQICEAILKIGRIASPGGAMRKLGRRVRDAWQAPRATPPVMRPAAFA